MADRPALERCRILLVEDEYMLAEELWAALRDAGAAVIGPASTIADALYYIRTESLIDCAVLDINLRGRMVYPAAEALARRAIPFIFTTGYDEGAIPPRYSHIVRCEKPLDIAGIPALIRSTIRA